jgi:valine dehydrogenase (NAD+)
VLTAYGVYQGMLAAAEHVWGEASVRGRRVAVEGVGKVGRRLVGHLAEAGAEILICDVSAAAIERVQAEHPSVQVAASQAELAAAPMDIYAPCALGGSVSDATAAALQAAIICGGANNQLAHAGLEKQLADRGIVYVPDYLVNSGGVIQVADELHGFSFDRAKARAAGIFSTTHTILASARDEGVPPAVAADRLAERRISDVGRLGRIWLGR